MPKLENLQDLQRLRDEARHALKTRANMGTTITVGMGTCGVAAGAHDTLLSIRKELEALHIEAHVTTVGCIGMCVKEPLVDIQQAGSPRVTYVNVKPSMVARLIQEHLVHGRVIEEWVIGRLDAV